MKITLVLIIPKLKVSKNMILMDYEKIHIIIRKFGLYELENSVIIKIILKIISYFQFYAWRFT